MTPALADEIRRLAAEGLSQRAIAKALGSCSPKAVAKVLGSPTVAEPAAPAPAEPAPATPLEVEIWGAAAPAAKRRRAARVEPPAEPAPTPAALARAEAERIYQAQLERARQAVEDHGYRGAPRSGWGANSLANMAPGRR